MLKKSSLLFVICSIGSIIASTLPDNYAVPPDTSRPSCNYEYESDDSRIRKNGPKVYRYEGRKTYLDVTDSENVEKLEKCFKLFDEDDIKEKEDLYMKWPSKLKRGSCIAMASLPFIANPSPYSLPLIWIGIETGDFIGGLFHLALDHTDVNNKDFPDFWREIALNFQDHHLHSLDFRKGSYLYLTMPFYDAALPFFMFSTALAMLGYYEYSAILCSSAFTLIHHQWHHSYLHGKKFTNKTLEHVWKYGQSLHFIASKKFHAVHHSSLNSNYTAMTGHTEPVINFIQQSFDSRVGGGLKVCLAKTANIGRKIYKNVLWAFSSCRMKHKESDE
ncbi:MAG: hypothetical protein NT128_07855 [Proteobacteria bacterium]|nr:hypothetical protein [Pseudomonadota bacterium]